MVYFWICEFGFILCDEKKLVMLLDGVLRVFDVIKFVDGDKCYDFCLFVVVNLCEVFDVGYVVYR